VLPPDREQPRPDDDDRVRELVRHQAEDLGRGPELDERQQVLEREEQRDAEDDLGQDERQQHEEVEALRRAAVPPIAAEGEGDAQGHGDQ
jgi:hypothetical protein